jgi:hypothetical protein
MHASKSHWISKPILLATTLGQWITKSPYTAQTFYFDPDESKVLMLKDNIFHVYELYQNWQVWFTASGTTLNVLPKSAVFTTASQFRSLLVCRESMNILQEQIRAQTEQAASCQGTLHKFIANQPDHIKWLLETLQSEQIDPSFWIQALNNGKVIITTNGSDAHRKGYFAVVLHTETETICFQGLCDGNPSMIMSYRTELTGILLVLYRL